VLDKAIEKCSASLLWEKNTNKFGAFYSILFGNSSLTQIIAQQINWVSDFFRAISNLILN